MASLTIFTDGGSRGNPGLAACAFVVFDSSNSLIFQQGYKLGVTTNNVAEYTAVLKALEWLIEKSGHRTQGTEVNFYLDSLLVVQQLKGVYKIKDIKLQNLQVKIQSLISNLQSLITWSHIPREQNKTADLLVNQTLDAEHENE